MYGVVEIAGHQYRVKTGDIVDVDKLTQETGSTITLDQILFVGNNQTYKVGLPLVEGASVTAKVVMHDRSRKIIIFKRKPGMYQRKNGHRKHFTALLITEINDGNGNIEKIDKDSKTAKKFLK